MGNRSSNTVRLKPNTVRLKPDPTYWIVIPVFVSFVSFVVIAAGIPQQSDRERAEALSRRATERLQALEREADRLASEEQTLLRDLRRLEVEREIKAEQFRQADAQLQKVTGELAAATGRMRQLEEQDRAERPVLRARLVEMYKLGQGRYLRLLLAATDLRRAGQASRTVGVLAELDRQRIAAHQRTLADLGGTRAQLESRRQELAKARADADRAHVAAERTAQARNDLIRDIDRRRDLNAQFAGELQTAQQKLQAELAVLSRGAPASEPAALPFRPFRGDLPWPLDGEVRRRFRAAGTRGGTSNGIEIEAAEGASVLAVHEGVVAFADTFAGYGHLVILDHGSQAFSLYGNLLETAVKRGARVERGQKVGSVGPSPTGAAGLYFELRVDGDPVDPLQWLRKR